LIASEAWAATLFVPTDYTTIQAAVNAASAGDIIEIAAGTYMEQVVVNKALTLNGQDGAVLSGTGLPDQWTTGVKIKSGNVTFNNLDVTNYTQDGIIVGYEASIPGSLSNVHITNCAVSNIQPGHWGFGIYVGYESEGFNYPIPKLTTHLDYVGLVIENNEIYNTASSALVIQSVTSSGSDLLVRNNNIHDNVTNDGIWVETARNLTIENNILDHNLWGIEFTCLAESWYTLNGPRGPQDVTVRNNWITNSLAESVIIYNGWPSTFLFEGNHFQGNTNDFSHLLEAPLNCSGNWWGSDTGPTVTGHPGGTGESITGVGAGQVDFTPWLATGTDVNPGLLGFQGDFSSLWVDDDSPQTGAVHRIQEGIDAATADGTVSVADGSYPVSSTLYINKALTLSGESEAGTVLLSNTGSDGYCVLVSAGGAALENFTIQRATAAPTTRSGYMIHASGTPNVLDGLAIRHVTVQGSGAIALHRAGIDVHGYDNVVLSHITSRDATYGNGIQITGCHHVAVDNTTTTNNTWGSLSIYCSQPLNPDRACDDVFVDGSTCTFVEDNVFIENQYGLTSTNINVAGYQYWLRNSSYRAGATSFIHIQPDLATAQAFAAVVFAGHEVHTSFQRTSDWAFEVLPGMSIQAAIDAATPGDVINVAAGTYAEDLRVTKTVDLRGPNYGISPNTGLRVAEAIIVPFTNAPEGGGTSGGEVVHVLAGVDNVSIDGFTIDGDNPSLPANGLGWSGADMHAVEGVTTYEDNIDGLQIRHNLFQNLVYFAVTIFGGSYSAPATSGHVVEDNLFRDLGTYDADNDYNFWGGGVLLYNSQYAAVTNNVMSNVRTGIQTGNFSRANPGAAAYQVIGANTMSTRRTGIFHNLHYGPTSPYTLSGNTITAITDANETKWSGITLGSLSVPSTTLNNVVDGTGAPANSSGIQVWNVKSISPATISGGSVANVAAGIFLNNFEGYSSNADDGAHATLDGTAITGATTGIRVLDSPSSTTHAAVQLAIGAGVSVTGGTTGLSIENATASVTSLGNLALSGQSGDYLALVNNAGNLDATGVSFGGLTGATASLAQNYAIEHKLTHKLDNTALGLARVKAGEVFVTSTGSIQRGIDAADAGDQVDVQAGLYSERIVVAKPLTLLGATEAITKMGYAVPAGYAWNPAVESIIDYPDPTGLPVDAYPVDIASDDVTFRGFVVQILNARTNSDHLLRVNAQIPGGTGTTLNNVVVENNVLGPVTNVTSQDGSKGRMGLYLAAPSYPANRQGITNSRFAGNKIFDTRGNGDTVFIWGAAESYASTQNADFTGTYIENNEISGSHRAGIELAGGISNLTIRDNRITNCSSTNGGPSDANLKYGSGIVVIRMGADKASATAMGAANLTITGNEIQGNEKHGIYLGPINSGHLMDGNVITGNGLSGVTVDLNEAYYGGTALPVLGRTSALNASGNTLASNGVGASVAGVPSNGFSLQASNNWWGDISGPYHAVNNPTGTGNAVTDYITFQPWMQAQALIAQAINVSRISLDDNGTPYPDKAVVTYSVTPIPGVPVRGMDVVVTYDPTQLSHAAPVQILTASPDPIPQMVYFNFYENTPGELHLSLSIMGATVGMTSTTNLFSLEFNGLPQTPPTITEFTAQLELASALVRGLLNTPLPCTTGAALALQVDGTLPSAVGIDGTTPAQDCVNGNILYDLSASDSYGLGKIQYQIGGTGGLWTDAVTGIAAASYDGTWLLNISSLGQGARTIYFRTVDAVGNAGTIYNSDDFFIDTVAPAVAGLDADPGYHQVRLDWNTPAGNTEIKIYRALRGTYPFVGGRPSARLWPSQFPGTPIATLAAGAVTYVDQFTYDMLATRGIYDYVVVASDCVNPSAATAVASATNYYLGDWAKQGLPDPVIPDDYDGKVKSADMTRLAGVYGTHPTAAVRDLDIAPTHDWSSYGLPGPDNWINFEDLMIFSMNYGYNGPELPNLSTPAGPSPELRLQPGEGLQELVLTGTLKGFSARLSCEASLLEASADFPVFFYRDGMEWVIDAVSLSGQLADGSRVGLRFGQGAQPELTSVLGRDFSNQFVDVLAVNGSPLPTAYTLEQNYPNPFNPTTTIRFALPEAASVKLAVYNALGQEVAVLAQGAREAGYHEVRLDGSNLASGMYIYRLEAGRFSEQKKLVLVK